jgi:hypothetical protein
VNLKNNGGVNLKAANWREGSENGVEIQLRETKKARIAPRLA